jgi:hypothetical protein
MMVIPETHHVQQIWYLRLYYYDWVDAPADELLFLDGITRSVVRIGLSDIFIIQLYSSWIM